MDKSINKENLYFYLVAFAAAIASVAAMCATAFWRATGGLAVGFALLLPAVVLACLGYSYPSPLNKVRCGVMMGIVIALPIVYLCLFVATDLAGAKVVLRTVTGTFQPNAMGLLLVVLSVCGILCAVLTSVRVIMHAFGHSLSDVERKLLVQSRDRQQSGQTDVPVTPRAADATERLAKADQEVRLSRMSVVAVAPETPSATPPAARMVSSDEVRRRIRHSRADAPTVAQVPTDADTEVSAVPAEDPAQVVTHDAEPPVAPEEMSVQEPLFAEVDSPVEPITDVAQAEMPADEVEPEMPASILVTRGVMVDGDQEIAPDGAAEAVIYAQGVAVDAEVAPVVELAQGEAVSNADIRTETAVVRPRQKEVQDDDIFTDFAYSNDPKDD